MDLFLMQNPWQDYAWGSISFIQKLIGNSGLLGKPVAELWMGAHPKAPSRILVDGHAMALDAFIASSPERILGKAYGIYDAELPFLLKVLAADQPLSIQAHPNLKQAREGFAREGAEQISLSSPQRNYKDDNHKPELICALTPFTALCGFRDYGQIISCFRQLALEELFSSFLPFAQDPGQESFRIFCSELLGVARSVQGFVVEKLLRALDDAPDYDIAIKRCCFLLHRFQAQDIGVFAPLLMNLVELAPGEALHLEAGILHAYVEGAGIEIMANSDNVLRGGLTPKHVDVPELCRVLDFSPHPLQVLNPVAEEGSVYSYPCLAKEFRLRRLELKAEHILAEEPAARILFCEQGSCSLRSGNTELTLSKGNSAFLTAATGAIRLKGEARLWLAGLGIQP